MDRSESEPLLESRESTREVAGRRVGFSIRAAIAGMLIGILINISNTYYGLIAGSSQQMPIVSALLGYLGFKFLSRFGVKELSRAENVLIASTATATGCMPVTAGFAELIPALNYILEPADMGPVHLSWQQSIVWSLGVAFFGIFFASLLRKSLILPKDMPWPGATASSNVIKSLHIDSSEVRTFDDQTQLNEPESSSQRLQRILKSAGISFLLTVCTFFLPILRNFPVFGPHVAKTWLWTITISPGFFGGGMLMGPEITLHMLLGAIVGWAILGPYAKTRGYAPGPVDDWDTGSRGWIVWMSLSALIADALVKVGWICLEPVWKSATLGRLAAIWRTLWTVTASSRSDNGSDENTPTLEDRPLIMANTMPPRLSIRKSAPILGFAMSILFCIAATTSVFPVAMPWYHVLLSVLLALPMAVVSIRTLGESDYNPQTGLLSQLFFASMTPRSSSTSVLINIISASISTAGASQTGDLAYDYKIGQLVGAEPAAQMYGQLLGSAFGAIVSFLAYQLYVSRLQIPGPLLQIPSSYLIISTAKLVLGRGLPEGASGFMLGFGLFFMAATIARMVCTERWWRIFIPSGVSFAVGIFLLPAYTISRTAGGLFTWFYVRNTPSKASAVEVIGSGLILGEAIASLTDLAFAALNFPQFGPKAL